LKQDKSNLIEMINYAIFINLLQSDGKRKQNP